VLHRIRDDDVQWRRMGDEVVILDLRTARYFSLNETGTRLWSLIVAGASADRLVEELVGAWAVDRAAAERDVEAFLASLRDRDLVADG
jgi:Coenzyme PQQ synthesis protein D (PqqD)